MKVRYDIPELEVTLEFELEVELGARSLDIFVDLQE